PGGAHGAGSGRAAPRAGGGRRRRARGRHHPRPPDGDRRFVVIAHLRGSLLERSGATVVVEVGGVGYEVVLSSHSLAEIGPDGSPVALRVYTHYQQNDVTLYGFTDALERQLFDL